MSPEDPTKTYSDLETKYFALIDAVDYEFKKFKALKEKEILDFHAKCKLEKLEIEKKHFTPITAENKGGISAFSKAERSTDNIGDYD